MPGDVLVDINGKSLEFKSFKDILLIIRSESENGGPRVLSFLRFLDRNQESRYFGEDEIILRKNSSISEDGIFLLFRHHFPNYSCQSVQYLNQLLCGACINTEKLRKISENGLPAAGGMRSLVWKVLLG